MPDSHNYYIGLISGTSVDGIDACLVDIDHDCQDLTLIDSYCHPLNDPLKRHIKSFLSTSNNDLPSALELDIQLGIEFAECANILIKKHEDKSIVAIGSHGQTLRHSPNAVYPFTYQAGNGAVISQMTEITTVNDFRAQDMALNGQGAPFAPLFHQQFFHSNSFNRAIINIGGISNITYLPKQQTTPLSGFDSGPGNALMDAWILQHLQQPYDDNGSWAASGNVDLTLLHTLLDDPYISDKPPKSTGPEHYNLTWLSSILSHFKPIEPQDVQATLLAFTTMSIAKNLSLYYPDTEEIYLCGGGANNVNMLKHLAKITQMPVYKTDDLGMPGDWIEACLFAWLAAKTMNKERIDLTSITGAKKPAIAGCIWTI